MHEKLLTTADVSFWGLPSDYTHQRDAYWLEQGFETEEAYFLANENGTKNDVYTDDFREAFDYQNLLRFICSMERLSGKADKNNPLHPLTTDNEQEVVKALKQWLQRVRITAKDTQPVQLLTQRLLETYFDIASGDYTLEEGLFTIQILIAHYLYTFEDVVIDLEWVQRTQQEERSMRRNHYTIA